jgi:hypothetical protein
MSSDYSSVDHSSDTLPSVEIITHTHCDAAIVHPHGQIQGAKDCWCRLYHFFGQVVQFESVEVAHFKEDIYCYIWKDAQKNQQPQNHYLERKLKRSVFGAVIMFRKGEDLTLEKAKSLLQE